jgi:methyl-accepting chemotaxis protein
MSTKLNDKLIQMCIEHSKTHTLNEAKETSTRTVHAINKLNEFADKLHQIHDVIKNLFGNTKPSDETSAQVAIANESIHSLDTLDVIDARLNQIFNKLTQIADKPKQATDESEREIHKFVAIVTSFREMINELSNPEQNVKLLLEQLKQSVDELVHATNQLTRAINESASNKSQNSS